MLLGELLVKNKVITAEQLGEVLGSPREPGKKLGQVLLQRGWITEAQLTQMLSLQLSVPWVSLYHIDFSRQLLNRLSREIAEKYCLIPIFVRHVKGQGETLYVAMDDPTNEAALQEVSRLANLPARPMIASASDIRSAIRVYYGEPPPAPALDVPPSRARVEPTSTPHPETPRATHVAARRTSPSTPPPPPPTSDEAPPTVRSYPPPDVVAAAAAAGAERARKPTPSQPDEPQPDRASDPGRTSDVGRARPRMVNLTLLDGTTISLPAKKEETSPAEGLTARDFVSALRATAHGADAREILGDAIRWEPVVAALLSILLRKGLIADWEFVEELRKI